MRYEVGLFRNDEQSATVEGFFVHVYVNRTTRRPQALAEALRNTLQGICVT